jgi:hypothetical protein
MEEKITNVNEESQKLRTEELKKRKKRMKIFLICIAIGILYNAYKIFWPRGTEKTVQIEQGPIDDQEFIRKRFESYDDSTLQAMKESDSVFAEYVDFLMKGDSILDSMDCNCPEKGINKNKYEPVSAEMVSR